MGHGAKLNVTLVMKSLWIQRLWRSLGICLLRNSADIILQMCKIRFCKNWLKIENTLIVYLVHIYIIYIHWYFSIFSKIMVVLCNIISKIIYWRKNVQYFKFWANGNLFHLKGIVSETLKSESFERWILFTLLMLLSTSGASSEG